MLVVAGILIGLLVGAALALLAVRLWSSSTLSAAVRESVAIVGEAEREAETLRREGQVELKERELQLREELERELAERRTQVVAIEERVLAKEQEVEARLGDLGRREQGVADRETHA